MMQPNKRKKNNRPQKPQNLRGKFRGGHFVFQVPVKFLVAVHWSGRCNCLKFLVHSLIDNHRIECFIFLPFLIDKYSFL